jgi:hypothetical protein
MIEPAGRRRVSSLRVDTLSRMLDRLTAADFAPHQGQPFRMVAAEEEPPFEVELVEVAESEAPGPARKQFSLVFRGGPDVPLPQRIYRVEHDQLGALEIFLVPIGPDDDGMRYQAVFG